MVDLKTQYASLKEEIDSVVLNAVANAQYILGPNVQHFEKEAADYLGAKHAVGCASGTDALHLALAAAGITQGDEVITSAFTFIATAEAICYVGAKPVFVDIDPKTFNIDPNLIEAAITKNTKAIIPVHIFGQPADMNSIMAIAKKHNLKVIEDCAQSFGAKIGDTTTGSFAEAGCHSFFPSKNLGAYGDGGLVTTNDDDIHTQLIALRNHGSFERYHHHVIGFNSRLDELQAAILRVKLQHIDEFNAGRYRVAQTYSHGLHDSIQTPFEDKTGNHVYHQYTVLSDNRDAIQAALSAKEIASAVYYPIPLHQQEVFKEECKDVHLPVTESVCAQCVSFPVYPEMPEDSQKIIIDTINSAF